MGSAGAITSNPKQSGEPPFRRVTTLTTSRGDGTSTPGVPGAAPLVFPSLRPTALLLAHRPLATSRAPRNIVLGHPIGRLQLRRAFPFERQDAGSALRNWAAGRSRRFRCALPRPHRLVDGVAGRSHPPARRRRSSSVWGSWPSGFTSSSHGRRRAARDPICCYETFRRSRGSAVGALERAAADQT